MKKLSYLFLIITFQNLLYPNPFKQEPITGESYENYELDFANENNLCQPSSSVPSELKKSYETFKNILAKYKTKIDDGEDCNRFHAALYSHLQMALKHSAYHDPMVLNVSGFNRLLTEMTEAYTECGKTTE